MSKLLSPLKLGSIIAKNRVFLAPMTRMRAEQDGCANDLMAEYYSQRASFGFIISECSYINPTCNTYPGAGAMFNDKHVETWKRVVDKVHQKGGKISLQLYHAGRSGNKSILGADSVGPSPIAIDGMDYLSQKAYEVPKELTKSQIKKILDEFHHSVVLAKKAGFDGVQVHGANGYLVDQFLRDGSNQRKDEYGGSIENRCRFYLEATDRFIDAIGADKVSVRLSPTDRFNDMYDSNPLELLKYLLPQLDKKGLQFIEVKRHAFQDPSKEKPGRILGDKQIPDFYKTLRPLIKKTPFVGNQSIPIKEAEKLIQEGTIDAVTFATLGIGNPDLPLRIEKNYPINDKPDYSKAYVGGASGYTDYPFYKH